MKTTWGHAQVKNTSDEMQISVTGNTNNHNAAWYAEKVARFPWSEHFVPFPRERNEAKTICADSVIM